MLIISETTTVGQQQSWALAELSLKVVDGEHWVFQSTRHPTTVVWATLAISEY